MNIETVKFEPKGNKSGASHSGSQASDKLSSDGIEEKMSKLVDGLSDEECHELYEVLKEKYSEKEEDYEMGGAEEESPFKE